MSGNSGSINVSLTDLRAETNRPEPRAFGIQNAAQGLTAMSEDLANTRAILQDVESRIEGLIEQMNECRLMLETSPTTVPGSIQLTGTTTPRTQLRIYCFGSFNIYNGYNLLPLKRAGKGRAILEYLAARPHRPVQRDVLLETFWPEAEPQAANNRLKVAMHYLRQLFAENADNGRAEGYIIFQDESYHFNTDLDIWTDVEAFEQDCQAGAKLDRAGRLEEAVPFYIAAESLYRGDYLADDPLEDWTLVRREGLKDTYLTILGKLSSYWHQTGAVEQAIEGWKKILDKDPWREDAYRQLMACFAARGQRGLAMRWYELCVHTLRAHLQLEPDAETQLLYDRIRRGQVGANPPW